MNRTCSKYTVTERVSFAAAQDRLACLRMLSAEIRGQPVPSAPLAALVDVVLKERVMYYSSALAMEPRGAKERRAVADALNALFDDAERLLELAQDLDWHHAVVQAARSYPAEVVPQLVDCLSQAARNERLPESEPLKRLVLESLKHCSADGQMSASQLRLGRLAASTAVDELRTCVEREEQLSMRSKVSAAGTVPPPSTPRDGRPLPESHVTLTLATVMVKSMISPGWEEVMRVWSSDPKAGEFLRCPGGVGSLLQCLELTAETGDTKAEFIKVQNLIVWRFVLALHHDFGDDVQPALLQALHWTTVDSDVWTKQLPRRRLAKVLNRLAHTRWQIRLPGLLAEKLPSKLHAVARSAPPIFLPTPPPPGLAGNFRRPALGDAGVRLPRPLPYAESTSLSDPDEKVMSLIESALQAQSSPIDAPWLCELRQNLRTPPPGATAPDAALPLEAKEDVPSLEMAGGVVASLPADEASSFAFSAEAPEFVPDMLPPTPELISVSPLDDDWDSAVKEKAKLLDQLMLQEAFDWEYWPSIAGYYYSEQAADDDVLPTQQQSWITNGPF